MDITMKKMTKRRLQAIETKSKIYKIGMQLINENGYESTSIDTICEACGISKGAYYHHYQSKVGLLLESALQAVDVLNQKIEETKGIPVRTRLLSYLICYAETTDQDGLEFIRECSRYVISAEYCEENNSASISATIRKNITQMLDESIAHGELKPDAPIDMILEIVQTYMSGFNAKWCLYNGNYSVREIVERSGSVLVQILSPYIGK